MFFNASNYNENLSGWNVNNVTNVDRMFLNAVRYDQDLSAWTFSSTPSHTDFDTGATAWVQTHPTF
jgi:hypothetical protein